jgi:uncharacterized protein (DUF488 family)
MTIFTVGHGTWHKKDRLIEAIKDIDILLDCRSHPRARIVHYNRFNLQQWIPEIGIKYQYFPSLGGFSKDHLKYQNLLIGKVNISLYSGSKFPMNYVKNIVDINGQKVIKGYEDFQWFMTLPPFFEGMKKVLELHRMGYNVALMCAEALWHECHRSMLSDYLWMKHKIDSGHLRHRTNKNPLQIYLHSENFGNRNQLYHPKVIEIWNKNDL